MKKHFKYILPIFYLLLFFLIYQFFFKNKKLNEPFYNNKNENENQNQNQKTYVYPPFYPFKKDYVKDWLKIHYEKQDEQALWKVRDPRKMPPITTKINIPTGGKDLKGELLPKSFNDDYPANFPHMIDTSIIYPFYNITNSPDQGNMITYLFVEFFKEHIPLRKPPIGIKFYNIPKIDQILFKENENSWSDNNLIMDPNAEWKFYFFPSKIPFILPILQHFMELLQKITNFYENNPLPTILQKWSPLRYAIKFLEISPNYLLKMGYYIEVIRQYSFFTILFYVEIFTDEKNNIIYSIIECIGTASTQHVLMLDDGEITNKFVHKNPDSIYTNLNKYFGNEEKVLPNYEKARVLEQKKEDKKIINNSYGCFDTNLESNNTSLIVSYSKDLCESPYDFYGRPKPQGLYDRPCKEDIECPFYQSNKNYKNNFGGCNKSTGFCELPIGVQPLGFRYYQPSTKPLCYNCNGSKWHSNSILDNCCQEQNNIRKYAFLKTPDFAFSGDKVQRTNQSLEKYFK